MTRPSYPVDIKTLRSLSPFNGLNPEQLELLASGLRVEVGQHDELLLEYGDREPFQLFLLKGQVLMEDPDGGESEITGGTKQASQPLARLIPRQFRVTAINEVHYLRVPCELMPRVLSQVVENRQLQGYEIAEGSLNVNGGDTEDGLTRALLDALEHNQLVLPSLPDVALRVGRAVQDETSDAHTIAKIVQADPAITAKLIGAANSAYYGGSDPVTSCSDAVVRLGMRVSHNLVLAYVVWELFRVKSLALQQRMRELWHHSNRVAAICHVLALRDRRFKPEEAMLIGLLHDIGVAAILHQVAQYPDFATDPKAIDHAISHLRGPIGSSILRKWGFPQEFIIAALEAEEWMREGPAKPDYCDLVIVAQLHSFIGGSHTPQVPPMDKVPALARLGLGELGPEQSLKILTAASLEIRESEQLLA